MKVKIAFGTIMLVSILALSAMAQYSQPGYGQYPARVYGQGQGRLSPEDQRDFDKDYARWVDDTRKNDQDDIGKDTRHMQDIMARKRIPPEVPFDQVASMGYQGAYQNGAYPRWQGRLSPEDQREFDKDYAKWVNDTRKNDRDDIDKDARKMQDIMARNSIPSNVPFSQIASN